MNGKRFLKVLGNCLLAVLLVTGVMSASEKVKPRKCILVFGAHADDVEGIAGGTFAKYIAEGYQGIYVCVTNNLAGNQIEKIPGNWDFGTGKLTAAVTGSPKMYQVDALETMQIRREEALAAAKVFGAEPVFLNFCEPEFWMGRTLTVYGTEEYVKFDPPGRKQVSIATRYSEDVNVVVALLRQYQPEITIMHMPGGEKLDHGESGYMMYLAFKKAISQGIPVGKLWTVSRGWLADSMAQHSGRGKADVRIDVRNHLKTEFAAWNKHISQNGGEIEKHVWSRRGQDRNFEEFITILDNTK
ncbi:MAG: PIG-L family deacetylase [Bacteroidota bacterium]